LKNILIIGSSGFVGKSLIDFFIKHHNNINKIYCISRRGFKIINKSSDIKIIYKKSDFLNIKKLPKINYIFYLINSKNLQKSKKIFSHFKKLLLKLEKKPQILFTSSGAIYGPNLTERKFLENQPINDDKIKNFKGYKYNYAKEKLFLEKEFRKLGSFKFKVSIARCFSFYGKHIFDYSYIISDLIKSVINKKQIILNNRSKIIRSYMHANDLAAWLLKICKSSNYSCPTYNVGSDESINVSQLAFKLAKKNGLKVIFKSKDKEELDYYVPSVKNAKKKLKLKITQRFKIDIKSYLI